MGYENDRVVSGLICGNDLSKVREAVCVQVEKVYDSCREKDCIEDARVLFKNPECIQRLLSRAINVKVRRAEVMDVYADIEPVPFKRGFYTVDVKFFIRVTLDFFVPRPNGGTRIVTRYGVVLFDKKVILFGSEGSVKIFKSHYVEHGIDTPLRSKLQQDNLPISKVEVAEPIALNAKIEDILDKCFDDCCCIEQVHRGLIDMLGDDDDDGIEVGDVAGLGGNNFPQRRVVVSLGLFSIIKLVRLVQLLIPAFDFCVPNKECVAATDENPCELFDTIEFPVNEFFPPQKFDFPGALEQEQLMAEEMNTHKKHHGHHGYND
ncbi:MAG: hypothetical protein N3B21_17110 [Clostridia bacterium]|nr:hypothetical protein [Clostridia bacterium]